MDNSKINHVYPILHFVTFTQIFDHNCMENVIGFEDLLPLFERAIRTAVEEELKRREKEEFKVEKLYYSLKEVSMITGLTVLAIKGRYRRGTLGVVRSGQTPLIPADEVERLLLKLDEQRKSA